MKVSEQKVRESVEAVVREMDRQPATFQQYMFQQIAVVERLAHTLFKGDSFLASVRIAPVYAEMVKNPVQA